MIAPVRPAYFVIRLLLIIAFVSVASVLIVEGVLIGQLGEGKPLMGHVIQVDRGHASSEMSFTYVTFDGRDVTGACDVPTEFVDQLAPGQRIEIYERVGLRRTYACVKQGLPALWPDGTQSIWWGLASGLVALLMLVILLYDLWSYSQQKPATTLIRRRVEPYRSGMDAINLMDMERLARERLSDMAWDYYASGANDEITLRANRAAFERICLHYHVLVDASVRRLHTRVLGHEVSMPILIAPTGFQKLAHPDGELATVRAAGAAETIMILSTMANTAVEDVVRAATGPVWFQLYVYKDRKVTEALVQRVAASGCSALVLTVDAPLLGRRERDVRNRFALPEGVSIENMMPAGLDDMPPGVDDSGLAAYFASLLDPALTWDDVDWLRSVAGMPVLVKGIVRADDARRAIDHGADGIVVSNHGGRQLDTAPATIDVLDSIAQAVGTDIEILLDGGVRRGTDVIKALALGARAVLIGRPVLWGLAADGANGVSHVLTLLRDELDLAMGLCGCPTIEDIGPDLLSP